MLIRPDRDDLRIIGFYVGKVLVGVGLTMVVPLVVALFRSDWNDVTAMAIGGALSIAVGRYTEWRLFTRAQLDWSHGMVTVALSWLLAAAIVAVPFYLSGHFGSYVDAYFDAMSGLTTSGLATIQDLDHLSVSVNLLRHLTHFAGGQGIIVVVLTVLGSSAQQLATLYVGEGRDDRIVPNIVRTARFIYLVATAYLVAGTVMLWIAGMVAGLTPVRSLFHGLNIFMAAFDTGGFAPNSTSMAYYHSATYEIVVTIMMIAGMLSFSLHFELWRGRRRELLANFEARTLGTTLMVVIALTTLGLARAATFTDPTALFRKGVFTAISAHSGTGFAVNNVRIFVTDWGLIAPAAIVLAMALGGMASSTAGGIKAIRIGLTAKSVFRDIRRSVQPDAAVVVASYRARRTVSIRDSQVRGAITIFVLFLMLYFAGAVLAVFYGYPFDEAMFESTSAAANVGLSVGIVSPTMPLALKLFYTLEMWAGRLEFMSIFALVGYGIALVRGKL